MRVLESIDADEAGVCRHSYSAANRSYWMEGHRTGRRRTKAGYTGAEKILIPHKSWPCGMAAGIPVPEPGVLVFEASLKLDQAYELGKTPYGQRNVFVFQEGTISGEKINGSVMPGGLDFQLDFSNGGMEIEEIFVLRTSDGKYIYLRSAGTAADPERCKNGAGF